MIPGFGRTGFGRYNLPRSMAMLKSLVGPMAHCRPISFQNPKEFHPMQDQMPLHTHGILIPVVPHQAVAEASKIVNL